MLIKLRDGDDWVAVTEERLVIGSAAVLLVAISFAMMKLLEWTDKVPSSIQTSTMQPVADDEVACLGCGKGCIGPGPGYCMKCRVAGKHK